MSLVEQYAAERKARLVRLGAIRTKPDIKLVSVKVAPKPIEPIDPAPFYPQMWFYDLIAPRKIRPKDQCLTVLSIRDAVCRYFKILPNEVESSRRQGALVYPRQIAFWLARTHTPYSYPQIGRRFGDRDHTTIMHGCRRIEARMKTEWEVAYDVAHVEAML
jgi:hypothetical protein